MFASDEWYTPSTVVEPTRRLMGGIDLDPASCAEAREVVKADRYYTKGDDGLALPWHGSCWVNRPTAPSPIGPGS